MKIIRTEEITPQKTVHDEGDNVLKRILFDQHTLGRMLEGRVPMINQGILSPSPDGFFSQHHHGDKKRNPDIGMDEIYLFDRPGARMKIEGYEFEVEPGMIVVVERGEVHSMKNLTDEEYTYLVFGVSNGGGTFTVANEY